MEASQVKYEHLSDEQKGEVQKKYEKRICRVREMQRIRYKETGNLTNAMLEGDALNKYCKLGTKEKKGDGAGLFGYEFDGPGDIAGF